MANMNFNTTLRSLRDTLSCGALLAALINTPLLWAASPSSSTCIACHQKINPNIVADWSISRHCEVQVGCADCHGDGHQTTNDLPEIKALAADLREKPKRAEK